MVEVNFRELVLNEAQLDGREPAPAVPEALASDMRAFPEVEVLASSFADSVLILRGLGKSDLFVLLMSRGQFYVRDNAGLERPTPLTGELLADCLSSLDRLEQLEVAPWVTPLTNDEAACRNLVRLMGDPLFQRLARSSQVVAEFGAAWGVDPRLPMAKVIAERSKGTTKAFMSAVAELVGERGSAVALGVALGLWHPWTRLSDVATRYRVDLSSLRDAVEVFEHPEALVDLIDTFGLDVARGYLRGFLALRNREAWRVEHAALKDFLENALELGVEFKPAAWLAYAVTQRTAQGVNMYDGAHWLDLWCDDLALQQVVHGRVEDKYPADLLKHRDKLLHEAMRARHALEADDKEPEVELTPFEKHTAELETHSYRTDDFVVRPPRSAQEMVHEGQALNHCVGTYVNAYEQGRTDIYLMRRASEPEVPYITIEVRGNVVRQAFKAFNTPLGTPERGWLKEWCAHEGIQVNSYSHPHGVGIGQRNAGGEQQAPQMDPWVLARRRDLNTNRPELWRRERGR